VYIVVGMQTLSEGSLTADRLCTCDLQSGYYSPEDRRENPDYCVYKSCSNGSVLEFNGMNFTSHRFHCKSQLLHNGSGQVVYTPVLLSPSSIIWY